MRGFYILVLVLFFESSFAQLANWTAFQPALFPTNVSGQIHGISRVSQMKFHPTNSNKLYAVSARGGLFISTNGGTNWTLAPGCDVMPFSTFASVCVDHTNDQIIYLGAGDHNYYYNWGGATGVWKSTDGGQTFTQTTLNNRIIVEMVMDPSNHNVIVAATSGGVYKTINGGTSWTLKTANREFDDLKQRTPVSRMLFAATTDSAFFRSTDFGDTWTQIIAGIVLPAGVTNGNGCRIAVTPADTNVVYLGMVANAGIIYRSSDAGLNFTAKKTSISPYLTYYDNASTSSGQGDYNFGIGVDRVNANIIYLVAHNVWRSTDGGSNWTQKTNWFAEVHTDMHQIITSPYNNNQLWNMNDGGVWLSTNSADDWAPKSDGIYGYEIYHGNCSPTRRDMMSIGTQDNGELYGNNSGWFTNRGGDWGSKCAFDYRSNSSMVYYFSNNERRTVTGGDNTFGLPAAVASYADIAFHRSSSGLAFIGDSGIYRTTNLTAGTPAWTQIYTVNKKIMAVHSNFADANKLYFITSDGFIYVSTNALAASPVFNSYALPGTSNNAASITSIKNSPNIIYAAINSKVYRSIDNGVNWTNVTYNLPNVNHVRILADEYYSSNEMVFLASNSAVYYKVGAAVAWTNYSTNLPSRTTINDMSIFNDSTSNTLLRVSTYGRGMWETPISNLRAIAADFIADQTNPCPASTVTFSDLSTGNVVSRTWSFPGGSPSSSTAVNPVVVYNSVGSYNVTLTVSNGSGTSSVTKNNYIVVAGNNLPVAEGFEGALDPPSGWENIDNGTIDYKWAKTSTAGGFGNSANSMLFDNYSWNVPGEKDELQLPRLDFRGYNSVSLSFDVAYQVFTGYADTLVVLISTDCGNSFTRVYAKGGSVLSTAGSGGNNFVPTAAQWRKETIDLISYTGQSNVVLQFQNINGYGNKLYIDNVNISATVNASAGLDAGICSGSSVQIGMNAVNGVSYSWSPSTGLSSSSISNPLASPTNTTSYILTATQTGSGILNKDTVVITVAPASVASVSIAANPGNTICAGTNVTFTATPTNGGSPGYQWKKNGNNVGTNNATYATNTLVNGDLISVVMTSTANCVSGSPANSGVIAMTVNPQVTASVSIAANPGNNICAGTNVTFTATPTNGGSPGYQWKKNGNNVGTNNASYSDNGLVNGDLIYVVMTSTANCVSGSPANSGVISMTVNPQVTAGVSIAANPGGTICAGTNVTFTATPVNGGSPDYQWKKNGNNIGANNVSYSDNTLIDGDVITCEMTSNATCVSNNNVSSNSIIETVLQSPSVSNFSPQQGQEGSSVTISGNGFTSVSSVSFNGVNATFNVDNSSQITATVPAGTSTGNISVTTLCGTGNGSSVFTVVSATVKLHLRLFIEGFYIGGGLMNGVLNPTTSDTITIELHEINSPYTTIFSATGTIGTDGYGDFILNSNFLNHSYYLVVKHRNSLETWSMPLTINSSIVNYDFTTAANMAFGNNQKELLDGKFALYSGDVNQSGSINFSDILFFENSNANFTYGYLVTDVTGDNFSESADYSLIEDNAVLDIIVTHP